MTLYAISIVLHFSVITGTETDAIGQIFLNAPENSTFGRILTRMTPEESFLGYKKGLEVLMNSDGPVTM